MRVTDDPFVDFYPAVRTDRVAALLVRVQGGLEMRQGQLLTLG
ncbi:hypothetical protein [Ancylobacter sp.]